jgi:hypothetical protein
VQEPSQARVRQLQAGGRRGCSEGHLEEGGADHLAYQAYKEADWIKLREDIKAAQKTIAHYNGTYIAMLKNWIGEVRARDGDQLGL